MSTPENDDAVHFRHQQFIDDIAERVEEKLVARFTKFLLINGAALIGIMATSIAGYYALDKRVSTTETRISINDSRIERLINEDMGLRETCARNQNSIQEQLNQIRMLFYDHDRALLQQRNNR
jgi:hypothetical protein